MGSAKFCDAPSIPSFSKAARIGLVSGTNWGDSAFMNIRANRKFEELPLMAKIAMPRTDDDVLLPMGQKRPLLRRYWLQVDRQTKYSFETLEEAEKAAKVIKTSHPILHVGIYDAEKSQ